MEEKKMVYEPECDGIFKNLEIVYKKMELSDEEIWKRILCKTTKVIEHEGKIDRCDKC
jgi:hypothetical protein